MTTATAARVNPASASPLQSTLRPTGAFDLAQSIAFGFGQREGDLDLSVMRLGFVLDGYQQAVGVAVRQAADGLLTLEITGSDDLAAVVSQVARILSVDIDSTGWDVLGSEDPVIGWLQVARPGLRPPLFCSAYEALIWSVLSARRSHQQMVALRGRFSTEHGTSIEVAGRPMVVLPTPEQVLAVEEFPGLPEVKLRRMHGVARAALDGHLDTFDLWSLDPAEAAQRIQQLEGIGPFYAQLVTIRALGHTDVLPAGEPRILALAGSLLGLGRPATDAEYAERALPWSPWRTWASVAIRAAGEQIPVGG